MYSPVLSTSKKAASAPDSDSVLLPSPSSVTVTSATLTRDVVLEFSAIEATTLLSAIAVGAALVAVEAAYTQSCGWLKSPPPFSLTT